MWNLKSDLIIYGLMEGGSMLMIFTMLGAGFFLVLTLMFFLWIIYLFKKNAGIVDLGWCIGFVLCAWAYLILGYGDPLKKWLITLMATTWAARLGWFIYQRLVSDDEDPRYREIRHNWGGDPTNVLFLLMFLLQGVLIVVISLPFLLVSAGSLPGWSNWETVGCILWFFGVLGEALADHQLSTFRSNPENNGKVCQSGLWRFSRHPNYFFETMVWVGFFLFAFPANWGFLSVVSPLLVAALLLKISGIPLTEAQALRTKGDAYREYQRTTNSFFPWFPKY